MAPFHFRLQHILDYRSQLEDQAKMAFATAQQRFDRQALLVNSLRSRLAEYEPKLYQTQNQAELWLLRNFVQGLSNDVAQAEANLLQLAQSLNKARQNLVKKSQERKLLDKLKENQAKKHAHEDRQKEQKQFDETATLRYRPQTI